MSKRNMYRRLRGVTWNLLVWRNPKKVAEEVIRLFDLLDLDIMAVQEAWTYWEAWTDLDFVSRKQGVEKGELARMFFLANLKFVSAGEGPEAKECFFIAREYVPVKAIRNRQVSDGWWARIRGKKPGRWFLRATFADWVRMATLHTPAGTTLGPDGEITPAGREDDILALNSASRNFLMVPRLARVVVGDWNRRAKVTVKNSPRWVASRAGAFVFTPSPDKIDYGLAKRVIVDEVKIISQREFSHGSDHNPVFFILRRPHRRLSLGAR